MFSQITLKFTERADLLTVPAQGVTVFVGPNNSGKSLLLREIERAASEGVTSSNHILQSIDYVWPSKDEVQADLNKLKKKSPAVVPDGHVVIGKFNAAGAAENRQIQVEALLEHLDRKSVSWLASHFFRYLLIRLDGRTRFELTNDRERGDSLQAPTNSFAHLFTDDGLRQQVRDVIYDAFSKYFVIDPTNGNQLRIRLSEVKPNHDEQSLNLAARTFHAAATYIKDASDGVQAFVGITTAVLSSDYRALLIDEPEAFLHPPLARKLGFQLATVMTKRAGSLLASTHSPDFLMGCLQASSSVRVVRLEYSGTKSKGQIVDSAELRKFFTAPLIRSANVISALFHDGVVVTESDNDRAFYSEIYARLNEVEKGLPSILFVNAQNKQTIPEIVGPLRSFGVPAVGVPDIDVLKEGGAVWSKWLEAAKVPPALRGSFGQARGDVLKAFDVAKVDMKKDGGVEALPAIDKQAANDFFDNLEKYGVFVTRLGELERWLPELNVPGQKTAWTVAMLQALGDDPNSPSYVRPASGDVWAFLRRVIAWVKNPARAGT